MIFISSPYSHPDPWVREDRYYQVGTFSAHLEISGLTVYSPIAMWHTLAREHKMPSGAIFWRRHNHHMLTKADALYVLKLTGWEDSIGVADEIRFFHTLHGSDVAIHYFDGYTFKEEGKNDGQDSQHG